MKFFKGMQLFLKGRILKGRKGRTQRIPGLPLVKDGDGKALAGNVEGRDKTGKSRAEDGQFLRLRGTDEGLRLRGNRLHAELFQRRYGKAAAEIAPEAGIFTGMIAQSGHDARQRKMAFQKLAGVAYLARGQTFEKGAHVHVERTGGAAAGRGFLGAAGLNGMKLALFQHGGTSKKKRLPDNVRAEKGGTGEDALLRSRKFSSGYLAAFSFRPASTFSG